MTMAERASDQEIIHTITAMHDAMIDVWGRRETLSSTWVKASLTRSWTVEVGADCRLTVEDERQRISSKDATPMEEYYTRDRAKALSLRLRLPGERTGSFLLRLSSREVEVIDKHPDNKETLSRGGLLRLLGTPEPQDIWSYIVARAEANDHQVATRREIMFTSPRHSRWPHLKAHDVAVDGIQQSLGVRITPDYTPSLTSDDFSRICLEGSVDLAADEPRLQTPGFEDIWIEPHELTRLEKMTLDGLTRYYGMSCQRYDDFRLSGGLRDPKDIVGLDSKASELATEGYMFGYETRPTLR